MKVLNLMNAEDHVPKTCGKNKPVYELVKKQREICASFAVVPPAAKAVAVIRKCLVKRKRSVDNDRDCSSSESEFVR